MQPVGLHGKTARGPQANQVSGSTPSSRRDGRSRGPRLQTPHPCRLPPASSQFCNARAVRRAGATPADFLPLSAARSYGSDPCPALLPAPPSTGNADTDLVAGGSAARRRIGGTCVPSVVYLQAHPWCLSTRFLSSNRGR